MRSIVSIVCFSSGFWILASGFFESTARAAGFEVVGLQNMAIRLEKPLDESAFLWMGDRIGGTPQEPEHLRVDLEGILVLSGGHLQEGRSVFEFYEYAMLSVTDSDIHLWSGRARIAHASAAPADSDTSPVAKTPPASPVRLGSPFGSIRVDPKSIVEADLSGSRGLFFCVSGSALFYSPHHAEPAALSAGQMVRAAVGRAEIMATPAEIQSVLAARSFLPIRYSGRGQTPPRVRWFAPRPGKISGQEKVNLLGRVDLSAGPVDVQVDSRHVEVSSTGEFSAAVKLASAQDTIAVQFKREESEGALWLQSGVDTVPPVITLEDQSQSTSFKEILLGGTTSEPAAVMVSGKSVLNRDRRFHQLVPIRPGSNDVLVTAFDRAGNRADAKISVFGETRAASAPPTPAADSEESGEWIVVDAIGRESPMSDPIRVSPVPSPLQMTAGLAGKIEGGKIRLTWLRGNPADVAGYNVYRIFDTIAVRIASVPGPPYVADAPDTLTELRFRVRAISAHSLEESDWSDTLVIRPMSETSALGASETLIRR